MDPLHGLFSKRIIRRHPNPLHSNFSGKFWNNAIKTTVTLFEFIAFWSSEWIVLSYMERRPNAYITKLYTQFLKFNCSTRCFDSFKWLDRFFSL